MVVAVVFVCLVAFNVHTGRPREHFQRRIGHMGQNICKGPTKHKERMLSAQGVGYTSPEYLKGTNKMHINEERC